LLNRMKSNVYADVLDNRFQYLVVIFLLVVGITAGTFTVSNMGADSRLDLAQYVSALFAGVKTGTIDYWSIFFYSLMQNTLIFGIITLFSLLTMGIFVVGIVCIFKGFCVGFTVGVLSLNFGVGGILAIVACTFFSNLVLLPCVCRAGVLGINNSVLMFKRRGIPATARDRLLVSRPHLSGMLQVYLAALLGVVIETLLTPALMRLM